MKGEILKKHIEELHNSNVIDKNDLNSFLEKYKVLGDIGINSNSLFYILNLNTMKYEYVNNACYSFTGYNTSDFYDLGMAILPKIMLEKDFELLSNDLFPKMNEFSKNLDVTQQGKIVFEIYYKVKHKSTGKIVQLVEFSSYTKFDVNNVPILSTGLCYESSQELNGVKGIVRLNENEKQTTLFEEKLSYKNVKLTKTENIISQLLISGLSRKEIALKQNTSLHTVNTHIKNMYKKLNVNKVSELIKIIGER